MTRQDLLDWESEHGAIPEGAVVLILDSLLDIRYSIFDFTWVWIDATMPTERPALTGH